MANRKTSQSGRAPGRLGRILAIGLAVPALCLPLASPSRALTTYGTVTALKLASGQPDGVYYEIGSRIQRRLNNNTGIHGLTLSTITSSGSAQNAKLLTDGRVDLAIMQADLFDSAVRGGSKFLPFNPELRAMGVVAEEEFFVVARRGSGIHSLQGMRGKRVGLGASGSGTRYTAARVLGAAGVSLRQLRSVSDGSMSARADAFCRGNLDAVAFVMSRPNAILDRLLRYCNGQVVSLNSPGVRNLAAQNAAYRFDDPADLKAGGAAFRVRALLVSYRLPPDLGEALMAAIVDPSPAFGLNRVPYRTFAIQEAADVAPYPMDAGAARFFRKKGIAVP